MHGLIRQLGVAVVSVVTLVLLRFKHPSRLLRRRVEAIPTL